MMRWSAGIVLFVLCASASSDFQSKVLLKFYEDCSRTDWQSCLKIKLLAGLEKFRNVQAIPVIEGLTFVDENFINDESPIVSEKILEENLPRKMEDRNELLNSLLTDEVFNFFSKYTLRWKLASLRAITNEGRGKSKKYSQLLMMPLMMAASFVPIALGALALLAGKALIVGKMALLLVGILGIRKLFSNSHDDDDHQRAMKRISDFGMRLKTDMMAQKMAYKAHMSSDLNAEM